MAQTKHEIQSLLAQAGTRPRHRFGQNFMIDQNLLRLVGEAGGIQPSDLVIEVGPGTGSLSEEILSHGANLLAVEIDRDLCALLRQRFESQPRFALIEGDALAGKHSLNPELLARIKSAGAEGRKVKLVANLPYNIASPLIVELLIAGVQLLAFTVQRELADRLRAAPGTEAYGTISVMAQLLSDVEILRVLPPQAFWPAPKVESALVRLERHDQLGPRVVAFGAFVQRLFSSRRKTLRNALTQAGHDVRPLLDSAGLDGQLRPEQFSPEQLLALFDRLWAGSR